MRDDKTGLDFLADILADRSQKPVWLHSQANTVIMSACMQEVARVLKEDDRFKGPDGDDAKGLLHEYIQSKVKFVAEKVHQPLAQVMHEGKAPDFSAWFDSEAMNTLKGQLHEADFTTDQHTLIFEALAKAELMANRLLASARRDYEIQQQLNRNHSK